jgi:hypothetical protein
VQSPNISSGPGEGITMEKYVECFQTFEHNENSLEHWITVCICCLRYPACNTHAPYCQLRHVPLYNNSPLFLIKGTIKKKSF